jgi:hypothetical protein
VVTLYRPDPRNLRLQRYCAQPACRRASKAVSQRRWLAKAANRDYFRGAEHVEPYIPHIAGGIFRQLSGRGMRAQRGVR